MTVSNFEVKAIDAERYSEHEEPKGNIRIDHNSTVTKVDQLDKKTARINFRFSANYSSIGRIEIEGSMVLKGAPSNLSKKWSKDNEMPNEVANEIHSTIISNCIPKAVLLAREVQLPPPIPLPQVNIPDENEKKQFKGGMEVA